MKKTYWIIVDKKSGFPKDGWKSRKSILDYISAAGYGDCKEFFVPRKIKLDVGKDWRDKVCV